MRGCGGAPWQLGEEGPHRPGCCWDGNCRAITLLAGSFRLLSGNGQQGVGRRARAPFCCSVKAGSECCQHLPCPGYGPQNAALMRFPRLPLPTRQGWQGAPLTSGRSVRGVLEAAGTPTLWGLQRSPGCCSGKSRFY